jgi:glycosyltransferase involved in cell wall biosynthesis
MRRNGRRPRLVHIFPTFSAGGAQARFVTLANAFGRDFSHQIVALDGDTSYADRFQSDVDVQFLKVSVPKRTSWGKICRIREVLKQQNPDLLITSNWGAIDWALGSCWSRLKHIHMEDGFGFAEQDRQIYRRVLTRRIALRKAQLVLPSRVLWALAQNTWRLPQQRLNYIANGIDNQRFRPAATSSVEVPVIGCVAALRPEKNIIRLLRAVAPLKETHKFRLVIAGEGPERDRLEGAARSLALNVEFLGNVLDPAPLYRSFTIFSLASDTEQMPLSVLEAMSSALPIAATCVGDIHSMVAHENQEFLASRDEVALSKSIGGLLDDPARARLIGCANRQRIDAEFGQEMMIERWRVIIDKCLSS